MAEWTEIKLDKLLKNLQESVLIKGSAALENCYANEMGGLTQFPGLSSFVALGGSAPTYLHEWKGDLVAVSGGRVWRIGQGGEKFEVTEAQVSGGKRVIFDRTEDELLMSAGGKIVRLAKDTTEILSEDAPESTHAQFIDGYVVAIERLSGRFYHCDAGSYRDWNPLNVFTAEGKPDDLNAMIVTPFRELIMTGVDSVEQFERLPSGDTPFFRRWAVGEGVYAPYTLLAADNGVWAVNKSKEFIRMSGQTSASMSDDVGKSLESIDDWEDAWAVMMNCFGQKFIVLQMPNATSTYDTKGVTFLIDYRNKRWYSLFGWDEGRNMPSRWPGWSYYSIWNRHFIGGNGRVYEMLADANTNAGTRRRVLGRTAHISFKTPVRVDDVRMRFKSGSAGHDDVEPKIRLRVLKDQSKWTRWIEKGLGRVGQRMKEVKFGGMGSGDTFQLEWEVTSTAEIEIVGIDVQTTALER